MEPTEEVAIKGKKAKKGKKEKPKKTNKKKATKKEGRKKTKGSKNKESETQDNVNKKDKKLTPEKLQAKGFPRDYYDPTDMEIDPETGEADYFFNIEKTL